MMARILAGQNRFAEAIELLRSIPANEPAAKLAALGQAADWYSELGEWDKAVRSYQILLEQSPQAVVVHRRLARLLNRKGFRLEAAEHLKWLCRQGNVEEEELRALITLSFAFSDEDEVSIFGPIGPVGHARLAYSREEFQNAKELLSSSYRDSAQAYSLYGRILISQQQLEETRQWIKEPVPECEKQAGYWLAKGTLALLEKRYRDATVSLAEAILLDPTDKVTYLRYGDSLNQLGQFEKAQQAWHRADLLRQSAVIGLDFAEGKRTLESIESLATILEELGRPFEALGWRAIAVGYQQDALSESQIGEKISELNRERLELIASGQTASEETLLCGITTVQLRQQFGQPEVIKQESELEVPPPPTVVRSYPAKFANIADQVGLRHQYDVTNASDPSQVGVSQEIGGGAGVLDYDLDGRPDVYLVQANATPEKQDGQKPNALYRNQMDRFNDITDIAGADDRGFGQGMSAGDINQDGFPDMLVANLGSNRLFINNGDGTFQSRPLESDQTALWTASFAIADVSGDALPDIIEINYLDEQLAYSTNLAPSKYNAAKDRIFVNDVTGKLQKAVTLGTEGVPGLGVIVTDLDNDRTNEIFIANDGRPNRLWKRQRLGDSAETLQSDAIDRTRLTDRNNDAADSVLLETANLKGLAVNYEGISGAGMGVASGDFNLDGRIDLFVTNYYLQPNFLMLQTRSGHFVDGTWRYGLHQDSYRVLGFGAQAIDVDNDSRVEIAVVNGHVHDQSDEGIPYRMTPQLYRHQEDGKYAIGEVDDPTHYWQTPVLGRGLARLDWNRDGRVDLLATHLDAPTALIENQTEPDLHWLQLRLVGRESERDAIGARISVLASVSSEEPEQSFVMTANAGDGFAVKNESIVCFGLGSSEKALVSVNWPSGQKSEVKIAELNQRYLLIEGHPDPYPD
ncbi:FG-GAP repeat protein [Neorhodopirellula pilleata]|uniref:FG-GAP repeat protein n=2 Tax=Neorhodopirellula pilleata TaxID=2714738 RepID=A0A5C6AS99_9BACT|nr:FG-GAP repeat protein [Neorhodopirellula pilleata]